MNTTGKIARLPRDLRIKLNRRLDNGLPSHEILDWLNRDKTVRKILAGQFESEPISRQNLSAWRTGDYQEWTNRRDAIELMKEVSGDADDIFSEIGSENDSPCFSDKMALWYTARYLVLAKKVIATAEEGDLDKQEAAMHRIGRVLAYLRRSDHSAARIRLQRDRFEFQRTQAEEAKEAREAKSKPAKPRGNPGLSTPEKIHRVRQMLFGDDIDPSPDYMKTETYKKEQEEAEKKRQAATSPVKAAQSNSDAPQAQNPSPSEPGNLNPEPAPDGQTQPENSNPKPETAPDPEPIAPPYNLPDPPPAQTSLTIPPDMANWNAARDRNSVDFTDPYGTKGSTPRRRRSCF